MSAGHAVDRRLIGRSGGAVLRTVGRSPRETCAGAEHGLQVLSNEAAAAGRVRPPPRGGQTRKPGSLAAPFGAVRRRSTARCSSPVRRPGGGRALGPVASAATELPPRQPERGRASNDVLYLPCRPHAPRLPVGQQFPSRHARRWSRRTSRRMRSPRGATRRSIAPGRMNVAPAPPVERAVGGQVGPELAGSGEECSVSEATSRTPGRMFVPVTASNHPDRGDDLPRFSTTHPH